MSSEPIPQDEVWELRNRIWDYAPDPFLPTTGEVIGPSRDEAEKLVAADIRAEIERGEPVSDFLRQWSAGVVGKPTMTPNDCNRCQHPAHNGLCLVLVDPPEVGQARCACRGENPPPFWPSSAGKKGNQP